MVGFAEGTRTDVHNTEVRSRTARWKLCPTDDVVGRRGRSDLERRSTSNADAMLFRRALEEIRAVDQPAFFLAGVDGELRAAPKRGAAKLATLVDRVEAHIEV